MNGVVKSTPLARVDVIVRSVMAKSASCKHNDDNDDVTDRTVDNKMKERKM